VTIPDCSTWADYLTWVDNLLAGSFDEKDTACHSCRACWCCDEPVYVDEREADHIIESLSPVERAVVASRTLQWLEKVRPLLPLKRPKVLDWRRLEATCPLLEAGRCMVYHQRPFGCRTFFAKGNPADCQMPMREKQQFAQFSDKAIAMLSLPVVLSTNQITADHLGAFLARKLCGVDVNSGSRENMRIPGVEVKQILTGT
jgi:Fe-S-cluster containining protein